MHKKIIAGVCFVGGSLALILALGAGQPGGGTTFPPNGRLARGHMITPVALQVNSRNVHAVMRGSYIVNAIGGCNDCHTCPSFASGHNPYDGNGDGEINAANFLAGGVNFGVAVSANLTPDSNGLPAGLTKDQFFDAIKTGHDPKDGHVLQVMPWPVHRYMIDADLNAIYEYLAAIPAAQPGSCVAPGQ